MVEHLQQIQNLKEKILQLHKQFITQKFGPETIGDFWPLQAHYPDVFACELVGKNPKKILEIGVAGGGSLDLWQHLYSDSLVYGVDTAPACKIKENDRCKVFIGNQADKDFLAEQVVPHGPFDFIIDDGSHLSHDIIASLEVLWPQVASNGIYLIEDLGTCYFWDNNKQVMKLLGNTAIDDLNSRYTNVCQKLPNLKSIHFYPAMCWLYKI